MSVAADAWTLPNAAMTPGAIGAHDGAVSDTSIVCERGYARSIRHPYDAEWRQYRTAIFREYGIPHGEWHNFKIDHLQPLELNGRPFAIVPGPLGAIWDLRNVWPQPKTEAIEKDAVEDALHRAVCSRRGYHGLHLTLQQADSAIARDWTRTPVGLPTPRATQETESRD